MNTAIKKYLSEIGRRGGSAKTEAQKNAARINGKLGGRPKKNKSPDDKIKNKNT